MAEKLRSLGAIVAAVLALSAALAATAQAQEFHTDAEAGKTTTLSGEQVAQLEIKTSSGTVKCKTATFSGSIVGPKAEMVALHPSYGECTLAGLKATINSNEIYYTYTWTTFWYHMRISIGPTPLAINLPAIGCTITIGEQTVNQVKFENKEVSGVKHILGTNEITGLKYTANEKCMTPGTFENGSMAGTQTVKGTNEAAKPTSFWVE